MRRWCLVLLLLSGCFFGGKADFEDCSSDDECRSGCCYPAKATSPWCSIGDECMGDADTGDTGGVTGACIYFHGQLNRVLCDQNATASGCAGKFTAGGSCASLSCPGGTTNPHQCSVSGGGGSGSCTDSYQGPTGDPQVSTQCMSVWNYRCQAKNQSAADQNCRVYESLEATVACPYCP